MMRAAMALAALLLLVSPVYIRLQYSSHSFLQAARIAKSEGRTDDTIQNYRKAASWRAPFFSSADVALTEMHELARGFEPPAIRLEAYRELRSAILNSRNFLNYSSTSGHREEKIKSIIQEAESEIDRLATTVGRAPRNVEIQPENKENFNFQILAQAAFWAWILSVFYFIFTAFDQNGRLRQRSALLKLCPVLAAYCLWICALIYA